MFAEHLKCVTKVFQATKKVLHSSLKIKEKPIDTGFIGFFLPGECVTWYPSPDYIEAGRFKLPKWLRQQKQESEHDSYALFYQAKKPADIQIMSLSAVGQTCDCSVDSVK